MKLSIVLLLATALLAVFRFCSGQYTRYYRRVSDTCASATCDYANMTINSNLLPVDWRTLQINRACSCMGYCAFYGDCCSDALEVSKYSLEHVLLKRQWSEIQHLWENMKPTCRSLDIGIQDDNWIDAPYINVQMAAECSSCRIDDSSITDYHGTDSAEVALRLPAYYEGLGIVFTSKKCAQCYQDDLDMSRVRQLPLVAHCNSSSDSFENRSASQNSAEIFCHYSLNISAVQHFPSLAMCVPVVDDIAMQEDFACGAFDKNETESFKPCPWVSATTGLLYKLRKEHELYKMCTAESEWSSLCGPRNASHLENVKCLKEGNVLVSGVGKNIALVDRIQRSDFSYRYMFDLTKLADNEEAMRPPGAVMCAGRGQEIFIERWQICVRRDKGDIMIGVVPRIAFTPPPRPVGGEYSESEWLDFSNSFFAMGAETSQNGTATTVLKKDNDPSFKVDSECFRYNLITGHFLVSYRCLCEIFRQFAELSSSSSLTQSIMPRTDDFLSLAGSVSIWVSLVCLIAVIVVLSAFPKLRNRPAKLVLLLSIFLCVGMVMILVNIYVDVTIIRPRHKKEPTYEEHCLRSPPWKEATCNLIGTSLHFSYLATFCLATALYIDLWRSVRKSAVPSGSGRFWCLAMPCCAVPLTVVLAAVAIDQVSPDNDFAPRYAEFVCWISEPNALFVFFVCPVVTCLIIDIVFFALIAGQIRANSFRPSNIFEGSTNKGGSSSSKPMDAESKKRRREEKRQKYIRRLGIYAKMALMMGLTWLIGCIAPFIPEHYNIDVVLWYAFVILNGLQGVFIFYTYVLNKKTFQVIRETTGKYRPTTRTVGGQTAPASSSKSRRT